MTLFSFFAAVCLLAEEDQVPRFRRYSTGALTAKDYQAPVPEDRGELDAYTTTDLRFEFEYRTYRSARRVRAWTTTIDVYAVVDRSKSWNQKPNDQRLLDHEQGHFALAHIAALRAQHHFATSGRVSGVASGEEQAVANLQQDLERQVKRFMDELRDENHRYDECTQRGLNRAEQEKHRRNQREQIAALSARLQAGHER